MKKLYFATKNRGKYESWKETLKQQGIDLTYKSFKFDKELDSQDLAEIASDKVLRVYENFKGPIIAVDAGFYITCLDGRPGPKVNPFLKKYSLEKILSMVKGKDRFCWFEQCIAYISPEMNEVKVFKSVTKGILSEEPKGSMKPYLWSELGLIFIPDGESKTLGEMNEEEWKAWRAKRGSDSVAVQFGKWYSKTLP